jgi:hypothetical protein
VCGSGRPVSAPAERSADDPMHTGSPSPLKDRGGLRVRWLTPSYSNSSIADGESRWAVAPAVVAAGGISLDLSYTRTVIFVVSI